MADKIGVAVAGGAGYMGIELLRLLALHPHVEVRRATSEQNAGKPLSEIFPAFRGRLDLRLEELDAKKLADGVDVVFSALPHGTAAATVVEALKSDVTVIDLSADFRLRDATEFRAWYGEHPAPALLGEAVYAIPEFARDAIRSARIIAAPGCYPTGALLGLIPLARAGLVGDGVVVVDSKSGASGAGRTAKTELLFGEVQENVRAYGVGHHRHQPEIDQGLRGAGCSNPVVFTPHLLPIRRGILSTIYVPLKRLDGVAAAYERAFAGEPFVQVLGAGRFPDVRDVRGTNFAQLGWKVVEAKNVAIVVTAIDNLGKGGSGQAVQALNVRFGFDERAGLEQIAAVP